MKTKALIIGGGPGGSAALREAKFAVPEIVAYLNGKRSGEVKPSDASPRFCEKGADNLEDLTDCSIPGGSRYHGEGWMGRSRKQRSTSDHL